MIITKGLGVKYYVYKFDYNKPVDTIDLTAVIILCVCSYRPIVISIYF